MHRDGRTVRPNNSFKPTPLRGAAYSGGGADLCSIPYKNLEGEMAVSSVDAKDTPEAQLRSLIERFDPKDQKLIRSVRSAVRKRLPTANELLYDYKGFLVTADVAKARWWSAGGSSQRG